MSTEAQALVVRARSHTFTVRVDGEERAARIPKKLRYQNPGVVDPVAVGDLVVVSHEVDALVIRKVLPRRNILSRPASGRRGKSQLLAANLDVAVVVMAADDPPWKAATIDRYLVLASWSGVPALICLNKLDLNPSVRSDPGLCVYGELGIPTVHVSAIEGSGVPDLVALLAGRTGVLIGPSGVGKSSLINRLAPEAELRVGEVSGRTGKGRHTTSWVEMLALPRGGRLVDSPGLRVLDLSGVSPNLLADHFPEIRSLAHACRFQDCRHRAEPGCAVKEAVGAGVTESRYDSYRRIHQSLESGLG